MTKPELQEKYFLEEYVEFIIAKGPSAVRSLTVNCADDTKYRHTVVAIFKSKEEASMLNELTKICKTRSIKLSTVTQE